MEGYWQTAAIGKFPRCPAGAHSQRWTPARPSNGSFIR